MSIPRIFRSSDTGANSMTNALGSGCAILDQVLVTGYPTQSLTSLTHSAGTITVTKVAHGFSVSNEVSISGCAQDEYNGRITVLTVPDADHFTYLPVLSNPTVSPATGTPLANTAAGKAALGWQLVATASNKRLYRPRFGTRMYMGVDESNTTTDIRVRGFEAATAAGIDTTAAGADGPFPTTTQQSVGAIWGKTSNNAANRAWFIIGDDRSLYVNIDVTNAAGWNTGFFGDFKSYKAGDLYNCAVIGKVSVSASAAGDMLGQMMSGTNSNANVGGCFLARAHHHWPGAVWGGKLGDTMRCGSLTSGLGVANSTVLAYPDPMTGGLSVSRLWINENTTTVTPRGYLPGFWVVNHNLASMTGVAIGDTCSGSLDLAGLTFELRGTMNTGCNLFETGAAWT